MKLTSFLLELKAPKGSKTVNDLLFQHVDTDGNFMIHNRELTSLVGSPHTARIFDCRKNFLTSLEGGPSAVTAFSCGLNRLTNLVGGPTKVPGSYKCYSNMLTSLEGAPSSVMEFDCDDNRLKSLAGAPSRIDGHLKCRRNRLTSLKDIHKHIKEIHGEADFEYNPIKSNVLGLLRIKGLTLIRFLHEGLPDLQKVQAIINHHLKNGNILECQEELFAAGLDKYAEL